jgi:DNA repair protein RecN (Recombination protein N)
LASGGELSRIILAIKSLTSEAGEIPILVFDEIDQGVGGQTAFRVGNKLRKIAAHHQIISITHLPQIACFAHHHLKVEKRGDEKSTWVEVFPLSGEERYQELARMMEMRVEIVRPVVREI